MEHTSTNAGPIAQAQVDRMMEDARPEIAQLLPEAIQKGAAVTFLVTDPAAPPGGQPATERARVTYARLAQLAGGRPLVALMPTQQVVSMLRKLEAFAPEAERIIRAITTERRADVVPIVVLRGLTFGVMLLERADPSSGPELARGADVIETAPDEYALSLEGALKVFYTTEPEDMKPDGRPRLLAFKARGAAAIAAEAIRGTPRDLGVVLVEAFGGARLREAWRRRGPEGFAETIDAVLASKPA